MLHKRISRRCNSAWPPVPDCLSTSGVGIARSDSITSNLALMRLVSPVNAFSAGERFAGGEEESDPSVH
jgi:hypothetical protein